MNFTHRVLPSIFLATISAFSASASAAEFPLRSDDINLNYRYITGAHSSGGAQLLGRDIGAVRHVGNGKWDALKTAGADSTVNANYIVYGTKIRAMTPGTVVGCWRNSPENAAGSKLQAVLDGYIGRGGNHVWIMQDDGVLALYAHAQPGTISSSICPHNATQLSSPSFNPWTSEGVVNGGVKIAAGQVLGIVGNSGNSTGPHLHVHLQKDGAAVAMKFAHGSTTPYVNNTAQVAGPWTMLAGNTLPSGGALVWPPHSVGYWTVNNIKDEHFQGWFNHMADSGEMVDTLPCSSDGQIYNTTWIPSKGAWYAYAGMTLTEFIQKSDQYASLGYVRTGWWYCGPVYTGIWRK